MTTIPCLTYYSKSGHLARCTNPLCDRWAYGGGLCIACRQAEQRRKRAASRVRLRRRCSACRWAITCACAPTAGRSCRAINSAARLARGNATWGNGG